MVAADRGEDDRQRAQSGSPERWNPPKKMRLLPPVRSIVTGKTADANTKGPSNTGAHRNSRPVVPRQEPDTDPEEAAEEHEVREE